FRRFDWGSLDLAEVKAVKNTLGGTVNDVLLACIAGAVRRFFARRKFRFGKVDYRVAVPVNVRSEGEQGNAGNRVSAWFLSLPVKEDDVVARFDKIRSATAKLKQSKQAQGIE